MTQWQYMRIIVNDNIEHGSIERNGSYITRMSYSNFNESLGRWGKEGWELVSHSDHDNTEVHMFKREIPDTRPNTTRTGPEI